MIDATHNYIEILDMVHILFLWDIDIVRSLPIIPFIAVTVFQDYLLVFNTMRERHFRNYPR